MKIYKCDSCGKEIKEPHEVKMKEFCLTVSNCDIVQAPFPVKVKKKIHLCGECFRGLYIIAKREDLEKENKMKRGDEHCIKPTATNASICKTEKSK